MTLIGMDRISVLNIHYENYSLDYFLDCQQRLGVQKIELFAGHQGLWLDHQGYQAAAPIRKKLEERGLSCPVFTPDNCCIGYQFAVKEPELVERCFRFFSNGIRFGAELGAEIFEANSGWGYWNEPEEDGFKRAVEMHQRLCEVAKEYGMNIVCESLRPQESRIGFRLDQIKHLYDEVQQPNFKAMIDITAMGVSGETIQQWFDVFGADNLIHCHFQDGTPYGHLIWGDGTHNLREMIETMELNGYRGLYSQEITDSRYFDDPFRHDSRNIQNLRMFTE